MKKLSLSFNEIKNKARVAIYGTGKRGKDYYQIITTIRPDVTIVCFMDSFKEDLESTPPVYRTSNLDCERLAIDYIFVCSYSYPNILRTLGECELYPHSSITTYVVDWFEDALPPEEIRIRESVYETLLEKLPNEFFVYEGLAKLSMQRNNFDTAQRCLTQAVGLFPDCIQFQAGQIEIFLSTGKISTAENLTQQLVLKFPDWKTDHHLMMGRICLMREAPVEALSWYRKAIDETPPVLDAYRHYALLHSSFQISEEDKDDYGEAAARMAQCLALFPDSSEAHAIYGKWLYDALGDVQKAKSVLLAGLDLYLSEELVLTLLRIAIFEGELDKVAKYKQILQVGKYFPEFLPLAYARQCKADIPQVNSLDMFFPKDTTSSPYRIVDAEQLISKKKRNSERPCIALFAYATPRSNLDVVYCIYAALKKRGYDALLFLNQKDLELFDFASIDFEPGETLYSISPTRLYDCDFLSCIITNDMAPLYGTSLPASCSLVHHAPHNTNYLGLTYPRAHYFTRLKHQQLPTEEEIRAQPRHMDAYCAIPNSYTKNEVLFDFFIKGDKSTKAICYCPTTSVFFLGHFALRDFWKLFAEYSETVTAMVRQVLDAFPDYHFIYRPWLGNAESENWLVAKPIVDAFAKEERFVFDRKRDSKYALLLSDVLITDQSGLAVTYSEITQRPFIAFDPSACPPVTKYAGSACPEQDNFYSSAIRADTAADVVTAIRDVLDAHGDRKPLRLEDYQAETLAKYTGIQYLVDNIDYILNNTRHPDWQYYSLT